MGRLRLRGENLLGIEEQWSTYRQLAARIRLTYAGLGYERIISLLNRAGTLCELHAIAGAYVSACPIPALTKGVV